MGVLGATGPSLRSCFRVVTVLLMPLFLYLDRQTVVHRRHPLVKVGALLCFFVAAFVVDHPLYLFPISLGVLGLLGLTGALANLYRLRLLFVFLFPFTVSIWSVFYSGGTRLQLVPFLPVTYEGVLFGLGMAIKLSTFLATSILFLSTTRVEECTYAFSSLGVPYRIGFAVTLSFRLVPLLLEAVLAVMQAQRCRGLDLRQGHLGQRLRQYVLVVIPVFMGVLRRADQMAIALEVRGFNAKVHRRTSYVRAPWRWSDTQALLILMGIACVYLGLWWAGYGRIAPGEG